MKTESLIRALVADTAIDRRPVVILTGGLLAALVGTVFFIWVTLGFRDDLTAALANPVSSLRFVLTGSLALVAGRLALLLSRPAGEARARLWPLLVVLAVALAAVLWAGRTTPPGGLLMAVVGKTAGACLISIVLLSVVPVAVILATLRHGATTAPVLAGRLAGLCGGGLAAMAYALHCTEDTPLFYVTWYGLAILAVTVISGLVGARLLRW